MRASRNNWMVGLALVLGLWAGPAPAEEKVIHPDVVVTATKTEESQESLASTVRVVERQEMEEKGATQLGDALRDTPGLWVFGNGPFGGPSWVSLRGSSAGQTRLMLDGVRLADPISFDSALNLTSLSTEGLSRVEVVAGPQSTLYGSDAMAGAINLITQRGQGDPIAWGLGEVGSHNTWRGAVGTQGEADRLNFFLTGSGLTTDGISNAAGGAENDGYQSGQFHTRLGYQLNPNTEIYGIGYFQKAKCDYDSFYLAPADSDHSRKDTVYTGILGLKQGLNEWWDHRFTLSRGQSKREYSDQSTYQSRLTTLDWQHDLRQGESNTVTLGANWEQEEGDYDAPAYADHLPTQSADVLGLYLQDQLRLFDSLHLLGGVRQDQHQEYGGQTTWRVGAAYVVKPTATKFKATYGTGFKAPTLYQLYSQYGSRDLSPEKSRGWDLGVEQKLWEGKVTLGLTYFHLDTDHLIDYDFITSKYVNVDEAESRGVEATAQAALTTWLSLTASYTYTDAEDRQTGKDLRYVPRQKATLGFRAVPRDPLTLRLWVLAVGPRYADSTNQTEVDGYTVVNAAASYQLTPNLELFGRIINLFNEDYQEIKDYETLGFSAYAGFRVSF